MRTTRGFDRLVTFVDAIVAIAITLLVLPLVDLTATESSHPPSGEVFGAPIGQIGTFLLSFVVIARLWVAHHAMFERVHAYDHALLWWTLGWVLTIVFLPFPTELVTAHAHLLSVRELYIGTMAVSSICQAGLAILIARRPALRGPEPGHYTTEAPIISALFFPVAMALTLIPGVGLYALLVLILQDQAIRLWRHQMRPRLPVA